VHEYVVRRNRWLRPLFGLKPMAASRTAPPRDAATESA
jgi:hypothetical protein